MKIIRIDVHRVHVPTSTAPVDPGVAVKDDYVPTENLHKHIIQLHTDDGFVGLGETWKGTPDRAVQRAAAEFLLNCDPTRLSLLRLNLPHDLTSVNARSRRDGRRATGRSQSFYPRVEVALADLVGLLTVCLYSSAIWVVLCATVCLVHYWSGRLPPEALARVAREGQQMGFGGIKIKCVLEDPNVERVQAVYEACGPDFRISLDPNQRFRSIRDTLSLAEALADYPVEVFEDPAQR